MLFGEGTNALLQQSTTKREEVTEVLQSVSQYINER